MKKQNCYLITRSKQEENTFGAFAQEILRAEGLMQFVSVDVDRQRWPRLQPGDLALVTRCFLTKKEIASVLAAAERGANLAFIQPQTLLVQELGGTPEHQVIHSGYVKIQPGFPGAGDTVQTHLPIVRVKCPESGTPWETVAKATDSNGTETGCPAVVRFQRGRGQIALFFYDLPAAVARIRFGDPDLASYTTLGSRWPFTHAGDLFEGHLDPRCAHLPQADLHGQLLAKVLTDLSPTPLGRFWYYEDAAQRSLAVLESDQDGGSLQQIEALAAAVEKHNGTGTFYLLEWTDPKNQMGKAQVNALRARGHTFGPHISPRSLNEELYFSIRDKLKKEPGAFKARYGTCSRTLQCHCAPWTGHLDLVHHHVHSGYRLLFTYLPIPIQNFAKYMCGSGRPMKFFDRRGTLHDCWQQPVIVMDDATLIEKLGKQTDASLQEFEARLQAALRANHAAFGMLSHPTSFDQYSGPFMRACFKRLEEEGVPIWNGDRWCDFIDQRSATRLEQGTDKNGNPAYLVSNLVDRLPLMIPLKDGDERKAWKVEVNGVPVAAPLHRRLEENYLFVPIEGGKKAAKIEVQVREV
jgi:hypothetical protein